MTYTTSPWMTVTSDDPACVCHGVWAPGWNVSRATATLERSAMSMTTGSMPSRVTLIVPDTVSAKLPRTNVSSSSLVNSSTATGGVGGSVDGGVVDASTEAAPRHSTAPP